MKLGVIGAGSVGTALAVRLSQQGYMVTAVSSRSVASAERFAHRINGCRVYAKGQDVADTADLVFITTPDDVIAEVAASIRWRQGQFVMHCSGADTTGSLKPARRAGACVGVMHPLQTFAGIEQAIANISGSAFALEAEEPLLSTMKEMVASLEGHPIELKAGDKVLYHAAAVIASNYLVTLIKTATDLWQNFGVSTDEAVKALLPLLKGTLNNVEAAGIPDCLTGPLARGDVGTLKKHLDALTAVAPETAELYRELGLRTVPVALAKGKIPASKTWELQAMLEQYRHTDTGEPEKTSTDHEDEFQSSAYRLRAD